MECIACWASGLNGPQRVHTPVEDILFERAFTTWVFLAAGHIKGVSTGLDGYMDMVTLNTLCSIASIYFATQHNRFFSEPNTFFEENNVLSSLWTTLFFARYCVTFSQVRWANLQSTSVKFIQDAVCQNH